MPPLAPCIRCPDAQSIRAVAFRCDCVTPLRATLAFASASLVTFDASQFARELAHGLFVPMAQVSRERLDRRMHTYLYGCFVRIHARDVLRIPIERSVGLVERHRLRQLHVGATRARLRGSGVPRKLPHLR